MKDVLYYLAALTLPVGVFFLGLIVLVAAVEAR